jgi:glycosyltransferase involved in cell wall biosynthesis
MISAVVAAFNEDKAVADTVRRIHDVLNLANLGEFEVVVVDDGSQDGSGALAEAAGARVLRHPHNIGYGRSLKSGIEAARFDTIIIADADGTYPIERMPELIRMYRQGYDMVVGARTGRQYHGSLAKSFMRFLLRSLVEWTTGRRIPDINSGLRVFSRNSIMGYNKHLCDTFSFTTSATLAYMMTGRFVGYLPISYNERIGQTHVQLWRDSLRTLQFIVQAIIYYNPLKIFLLMSLICVAGAAVSILIGIVFHLATGFMMGVGTLLVAILIFALGLLADLLRQILGK